MKERREKLNICSLKHLGDRLGMEVGDIQDIAKNVDAYYRQWESQDKKGKLRQISEPKGKLKDIQRQVNRMLQALALPDFVYGGRRGRSHFDNAARHCGQPMVLKSDLRAFFPSVGYRRVYQVFWKRLGCAPDVARTLTRLTTLNGCLPTGGPASTMLATFAAEDLFFRLDSLANGHGAIFSVYVDDITISGPVHLERFRSLLIRIITSAGFKASLAKTVVMPRAVAQTVTGIRVNDGLDVSPEKLAEVRTLVEEMESDVRMGENVTKKRIEGLISKVDYISICNGGAGRVLKKRVRRAAEFSQ